jgi:hypothetical protein
MHGAHEASTRALELSALSINSMLFRLPVFEGPRMRCRTSFLSHEDHKMMISLVSSRVLAEFLQCNPTSVACAPGLKVPLPYPKHSYQQAPKGSSRRRRAGAILLATGHGGSSYRATLGAIRGRVSVSKHLHHSSPLPCLGWKLCR